MIKLFEPGRIMYPEKGMNKPVEYTEADLQKIADNIDEVEIKNGHNGEVIGKLDNIIFKDGALYADAPTNIDLKGYGLSPEFHFGLVDNGDYCTPYDISLLGVALTDKPKSQIYYNSKGDVNVDIKEKEELLNTISDNQKRIRQQEQEIGILKNKEKEYKEELAISKDLNKEVTEAKKALAQLQEENEKLKVKAEAYDNIEIKEKEEIIKEISGDNEEVKERLSKMSLEDIKFLKEKKLVTTDPKGVPANSAPGLQDGSKNKSKKKPDEVTYDDYTVWKKQNNVR